MLYKYTYTPSILHSGYKYEQDVVTQNERSIYIIYTWGIMMFKGQIAQEPSKEVENHVLWKPTTEKNSRMKAWTATQQHKMPQKGKIVDK